MRYSFPPLRPQLGQQHDNTRAKSQAEFLKQLWDVHTLHITGDTEGVQIILSYMKQSHAKMVDVQIVHNLHKTVLG
jgi:hypothetical protein